MGNVPHGIRLSSSQPSVSIQEPVIPRPRIIQWLTQGTEHVRLRMSIMYDHPEDLLPMTPLHNGVQAIRGIRVTIIRGLLQPHNLPGREIRIILRPIHLHLLIPRLHHPQEVAAVVHRVAEAEAQVHVRGDGINSTVNQYAVYEAFKNKP